MKRAAHELRSENLNDNFYILDYPDKEQQNINDDSTLLLNLFLKNNLYKNRPDLIRRFYKFLKTPQP